MMNEYRSEIRGAVREGYWTVWKLAPLVVLIIALLSIVGFGLKSLGLFGSTVVERVVFENSYQRSEAIKSQIATDEAVLAEIQHQLATPGLDEDTRNSLEAQAAAARVRMATARGKQ